MDPKSDFVTLYTRQQAIVVQTLLEAGVYRVKWEYITQKYGEVAHVFQSAYRWYAAQAARMVPKPKAADSAVWVFAHPSELDASGGGHTLALSVPREQVIFFDRMDWEKILQLRYVGTPQAEQAFAQKLENQGVRHASDVLLTPYYPLLKRELESSWKELFRHNTAIHAGEAGAVRHVQAGLWELRRDWLVSVDGTPAHRLTGSRTAPSGNG